MGRPFNSDLSIDWKIPLPASLAGRVEFRLFDATTGRPTYGARRKLIIELLEEWLDRQERADVNAVNTPEGRPEYVE